MPFLELDLKPDSFFNLKIAQDNQDDTIFKIYKAFVVTMKYILLNNMFTYYGNDTNFSQAYHRLFTLDILKNYNFTDKQLQSILFNIDKIRFFAGTPLALLLLGIITTGGNNLIYEEVASYDGSFVYDGTKKYTSTYTANGEGIVFVDGAFLINLINGSDKLLAIINKYKSSRDYAQIV